VRRFIAALGFGFHFGFDFMLAPTRAPQVEWTVGSGAVLGVKRTPRGARNVGGLGGLGGPALHRLRLSLIVARRARPLAEMADLPAADRREKNEGQSGDESPHS